VIVLIHYVALTVERPKVVSLSELTKVGAALQKQVSRDFAPLWGVHGIVSAFATPEDVPLGYWPVIVTERLQGSPGYHEDKSGQPFALVEAGNSWSLTASHETLEMLADPFGKRLIAGQSPKPGQGRVGFLVEVCDPTEAAANAYTVNGILVSDFYTPRYFDPVRRRDVQYSYSGAVKRPRQVLPGGYISWHDPKSNHWWQQSYFGRAPKFKNLGVFDNSKFQTFRAFTDSHAPETQRLAHLDKASRPLKAALKSRVLVEQSTSSRARLWRSQIEALREEARSS
jgi:hypothetical protein